MANINIILKMKCFSQWQFLATKQGHNCQLNFAQNVCSKFLQRGLLS